MMLAPTNQIIYWFVSMLSKFLQIALVYQFRMQFMCPDLCLGHVPLMGLMNVHTNKIYVSQFNLNIFHLCRSWQFFPRRNKTRVWMKRNFQKDKQLRKGPQSRSGTHIFGSIQSVSYHCWPTFERNNLLHISVLFQCRTELKKMFKMQ